MTKLRVVHSTVYRYSRPIVETQMEVRLWPADGMGQRVLEYRLDTEPFDAARSYVDGFGNRVQYFNQVASHEVVSIVSHSLVETSSEPAADPVEAWPDFLLFRPPVLELREARALARRFQALDRRDPGQVEDSLDRLTHHLAETFEYVPNSTTVHTAVDEVFASRRGVCQDFAHLLISIARAMDIPARYVSGYVYTGSGEPVSGASHAWAECYVPGRGWKGWDATHPLRAGPNHVRVAVGRDYRDAAPTRGVFVGDVSGAMEVSVTISVA